MKENIFLPCFYRVSVKALIYKNKKILLVKEDTGKWELPGGGLEFEETFTDGLKREIKEELGVNVIKTADKPKYIWKIIHKGKPKLILCFVVKIDSFNFVHHPKESVETGFFSKEEIKKIYLNETHQELIELIK